jgi:uncharacterized membrane protein
MTERAERSGSRRIVDTGRLWIGGLMAGVVAAGVADAGGARPRAAVDRAHGGALSIEEAGNVRLATNTGC